MRDQSIAAGDANLAVNDAPTGLENLRFGDEVVRRSGRREKIARQRRGGRFLLVAVNGCERKIECRIAQRHDRAAVDGARSVCNLAPIRHPHAGRPRADRLEFQAEERDERRSLA